MPPPRRSTIVAHQLEPLLRRLDPLAGLDRPFSVRFWDGSELPASTAPARFAVDVRDPAALAHLVRTPGQLGLSRAWVSGALTIEGDLAEAFALLEERVAGVRLGARDWLELARIARRLGALRRRPPVPESEARLPSIRLRGHARSRDRRAVRLHYEAPNSFYRLFIGDALVYSCAVFEPGDTLEQAQRRKLDLICRKLELRPGDRLLDIGCGWGALMLHAVREYGVDATGITLSRTQASEAQRRIDAAGLSDRCRVSIADYRELEDGSFDAITSVGMYEHIGRTSLPTYADRLWNVLAPGGRLLNHGITRVGHDRRNQGAFIGRYVYPSGDLHPIGLLLGTLEQQGFELRHVETLREHYARTLEHWVANLEANREEAIRLGGEERERIWRLFMTASIRAFGDGALGCYQTLAHRPGGAAAEPAPATALPSAALPDTLAA